jgi:hypothetical protein
MALKAKSLEKKLLKGFAVWTGLEPSRLVIFDETRRVRAAF